MGFLDNLLKGEVKKAVGNLVGAAINETLNNNTTYNSQPERSFSNTSTSKKKNEEADLRAKLESIIASEYTEYELRREIPASEIGADLGAKSYSYGLYLNGSPKAFIMIMKDRNHYRSLEVRLAQDAAYAGGIPYMNFMKHLPNEVSYISDRLRKNIFG